MKTSHSAELGLKMSIPGKAPQVMGRKTSLTPFVVRVSRPILLLLTIFVFEPPRSRGDEAFKTQGGTASTLLQAEGSYGWAFLPSDALGKDQYIEITAVGVYDGGADGLATSHPIALWRYLGVNQGELLANAVVSAGTSAPLVDGYRYSSITPVVVPPRSIIVVGAQYAQSDPDNNVIPFTGTVAPALKFAGSLGTPGPNLPMPAGGYSQGEGSPNYAFFPVNFQFQIIPEPPPWLVLASGLALFLLKAAEENYKEWNEKNGTS